MSSFAFHRLVLGADFAHMIVRRRAAMTRMRLDAVPLYNEYHPRRVFNAGKYFDSVRAGKSGVFECLPELSDILVALCRIDGLNQDLMNHFDILSNRMLKELFLVAPAAAISMRFLSSVRAARICRPPFDAHGWGFIAAPVFTASLSRNSQHSASGVEPEVKILRVKQLGQQRSSR